MHTAVKMNDLIQKNSKGAQLVIINLPPPPNVSDGEIRSLQCILDSFRKRSKYTSYMIIINDFDILRGLVVRVDDLESRGGFGPREIYFVVWRGERCLVLVLSRNNNSEPTLNITEILLKGGGVVK